MVDKTDLGHHMGYPTVAKCWLVELMLLLLLLCSSAMGVIYVVDDLTCPYIDAGDPLTPVMYEPHPRGCFINMGAYGGTEQASKSTYSSPYKPIGE